MIEHTNLILRAHEAPHECSDPQCPGNVNRRKLEAFDGLLAVCKRYYALFDKAAHVEAGSLAVAAHTAIAKAKE